MARFRDIDPSDAPPAFGIKDAVGPELEAWLEDRPIGTTITVRLGMESHGEEAGEPVMRAAGTRTIEVEWTGDIQQFWDDYFDATREEWDDFKGAEDVDTEGGAVWVTGVSG